MIKIKNGQLIMYDIDEKYKDYLRRFDNKVSKKENRKFYGILLTKNNVDYYVPFTSKIEKKTNSRLTVNIKDKNEIIAKLLLNNMIPVNIKNSRIVDINVSKYRDYYNKEISYLRSEKVKEEIIRKTNNIFEILSNTQNSNYSFFKRICCDFSLLEEKCFEYKIVQDILDNTKFIHNEEELFYIYDELENKDLFEECVKLMDKPELSDKIQNLNISKFEEMIKKSN